MKNRIRQLRKEKHMTQVRLSIELEVTQEAVSAYETARHSPSVSSLIKMTEIFHASSDYILGLSDIRYPSLTHNLRKDEHLILEKWNGLNCQQKQLLAAYADGLAALSEPGAILK